MFMPRNMRFGPRNATSIDLCVHDLVANSRHRGSTTILCCENEPLFDGFAIETYPKAIDASKRRKLAFALERVHAKSPDLIVVQQHLPTAVALARKTSIPVILHKHNFVRPINGSSLGERLRRHWRLRQLRSLAGLIFVSHACKAAFQLDWPEVQSPLSVVSNGLQFSQWASGAKAKEIICVSRAAPEKGVLESAQAIAAVLRTEKEWRARLILSEADRMPEYASSIMKVLQPVCHRTVVDYDQPFEMVKGSFQRAAIAIVASKWKEPFGRVALEAHAAGCAVITSGTGGLSEISAGHAEVLPDGFGVDDIIHRLTHLINAPARRKELAESGRAYCKTKFDISQVSKQADAFYESIAR
jgi:glycosyltransferase involved in cell wall biosynthesis